MRFKTEIFKEKTQKKNGNYTETVGKIETNKNLILNRTGFRYTDMIKIILLAAEIVDLRKWFYWTSCLQKKMCSEFITLKKISKIKNLYIWKKNWSKDFHKNWAKIPQ